MYVVHEVGANGDMVQEYLGVDSDPKKVFLHQLPNGLLGWVGARLRHLLRSYRTELLDFTDELEDVDHVKLSSR